MAITVFNKRTDPGRFTLAPLAGRTVAVLGYGNQGRAQALCLRDSGVSCIVGLRSHSRSRERASSEGFAVHSLEAACNIADLIIMALPDEAHGEIYARAVDPQTPRGATVGFLHGSSVRFGAVKPRSGIGVVLLAPKGPGTTLRDLFVEGKGLPALYALHQDSSRGDSEPLAFAWASAIGAGESGVISATFAAEAETDLFGEQAVLCGGMLALMVVAFETLVQAGYEPELAYLECCHELKQVADILYARGPAGMCSAISNTAEFGAYRTLSRFDDSHLRSQMNEVLRAVESGDFAKAVGADATLGFPWLAAERERLRQHPITGAGDVIRDLMPWLKGR
jgi:ketol-acid reductoisomerase